MNDDLTYLTLIYGNLNDYNLIDNIPADILVSAYKKCFPISSLEDDSVILGDISYYYKIEMNYKNDSYIKYKKYLLNELLIYHSRESQHDL